MPGAGSGILKTWKTGGHPDGGMRAAVDVHYLSTGGARAAAVLDADSAFVFPGSCTANGRPNRTYHGTRHDLRLTTARQRQGPRGERAVFRLGCCSVSAVEVVIGNRRLLLVRRRDEQKRLAGRSGMIWHVRAVVCASAMPGRRSS